MQTKTEKKENMRCPLSVININNKKDKKHPTAKPIELYDWLIKRYSNEGDTILDPTAGSFNSGHSALGLERNYIGMEMNDEFYDNNKI
jgi:site-specific DNA-methyltransferase (adenine-specific)